MKIHQALHRDLYTVRRSHFSTKFKPLPKTDPHP